MAIVESRQDPLEGSIALLAEVTERHAAQLAPVVVDVDQKPALARDLDTVRGVDTVIDFQQHVNTCVTVAGTTNSTTVVHTVQCRSIALLCRWPLGRLSVANGFSAYLVKEFASLVVLRRRQQTYRVRPYMEPHAYYPDAVRVLVQPVFFKIDAAPRRACQRPNHPPTPRTCGFLSLSSDQVCVATPFVPGYGTGRSSEAVNPHTSHFQDVMHRLLSLRDETPWDAVHARAQE